MGDESHGVHIVGVFDSTFFIFDITSIVATNVWFAIAIVVVHDMWIILGFEWFWYLKGELEFEPSYVVVAILYI